MILSADGRTPIQSDAEKQQVSEKALRKMQKLVQDAVAMFQQFEMEPGVPEQVTVYEGALVGLNLIMTFLKSMPTLQQTQEGAVHMGQMIDHHLGIAMQERLAELKIRDSMMQAANQQSMPT